MLIFIILSHKATLPFKSLGSVSKELVKSVQTFMFKLLKMFNVKILFEINAALLIR